MRARQGCFIRSVRKIPRIVLNANLIVLNKPGRIIRLQILPFWGDFRPFKAVFRPETTTQRARNAIV